MKKLTFGATAVFLFGACSSGDRPAGETDLQNAPGAIGPTPDVAVGSTRQSLVATGGIMANRCGDVLGLQDSASWPMLGGCPTHAAIAPVHGTTQSTRNWRVDLVGAVESTATISVDGVAYVGSNQGSLTAINPQNGQVLWDLFLRGVIRSAAAIGRDGTLYVGTEGSGLHAVDPVTHLEKWSFDPSGTMSASPVIGTDGTIYIGNHAGSLFAVNPDGTQKWKYGTAGAIQSSAAIGTDGTIYFGSDDNSVYALTPQGGFKWKRTVANDVRSSPAVGDGTVYVGSDANKLHALDAATGAIRWERDVQFAGVRSSPAIGLQGNVLIGAANSRVLAYSPAGALLWSYTTGGAVNSTPVIDADGRLYIGSDDRKLHVINSITGLPVFTFSAAAAVRSPALDADGRVVFGTTDGSLYSVGLGSRANQYIVDSRLVLADPVDIDSLTGQPQPVSVIVDSEGNRSIFVSDMIMVEANPAQLSTYLGRYGGTVVETMDIEPDPDDDVTNIYSIRIDKTRTVDPATFATNAHIIDPDAEPERFAISDPAALSLLATWAEARAAGLEVEIDVLGDPVGVATGVTTEGAAAPFAYGGGATSTPGEKKWTKTGGNWSTNPFDWVHFAKDTMQGIGVPEAWQLLNNAGRLTRSVTVAIIDTGFSKAAVPASEYPNATLKPIVIGPVLDVFAKSNFGGDAWHGTGVLDVGFGMLDNRIGAAGTGEPVVKQIDLAAYRKHTGKRQFTRDLRYIINEHNVDIVNVSAKFDTLIAIGGGLIKTIIGRASKHNILLIAGAGQNNESVDKKTGVLHRERSMALPCERGGVLCVSGVDHDSLSKHPKANWGDDDVDIWAPYTAPAGPLPDNRGTEEFRGTSGSTAYVSGVAALVKAANPSLSRVDIMNILMETAKPSSDPKVAHGVVQAFAAVQRALATTGPSLQIAEPEENVTLPFSTSPLARAGWADGRTGAPAPTVDWTVNGTSIGRGLTAQIPGAVLKVGSNVIEARGTFMGGTVLTDSVAINRSLPGSLRILLPVPGQAIRPEDSTRLLVEPLVAAQWFEDGSGSSFVTGGDVTRALPNLTPGAHTLRAFLTDGSQTRTDTTNVVVLPAGFPKTALSITTPSVGFLAEAGQATAFSATALDTTSGGTVPTTGTILWGITNAAGDSIAVRTGPSGTVVLPAIGTYVFSAVVQKSIDMNGDGVLDTLATVAADSRSIRASVTPP